MLGSTTPCAFGGGVWLLLLDADAAIAIVFVCGTCSGRGCSCSDDIDGVDEVGSVQIIKRRGMRWR